MKWNQLAQCKIMESMMHFSESFNTFSKKTNTNNNIKTKIQIHQHISDEKASQKRNQKL